MPLPSDNDLTFRTDDATRWGTGKGSPLTKVEGDMNLWTLLTYIADLESNQILPVEIQSITVDSNNKMLITMTDSSTFGPFQLPEQAFHWTGDFQGTFDYSKNDVFSAEDGAYLVLQEHTSASTFDPDANNMSGPLYALMFPYQNIYDISFYAPGIVGNGLSVGDEMFGLIFARDAYITPALGLTSQLAFSGEPGGPFTCDLQKNGVSIGNLFFDPTASSSAQAVITIDADTNFTSGDVFSVMRPDGTDLDVDAKGMKVTFMFKKGAL